MRTLEDIKDQIEHAKCRWCNTNFDFNNAEMYDHSGGLEIEGLDKRQWVFVHCPKCRYDWAIKN